MNYFLKFAVVGGFGFVVDSLCYLIFSNFLPIVLSRLLSFSLAVVFTYLFNKIYTFNARGVTISEFFRYYVNMIFGGFVNLVFFYASISMIDFVSKYPVIGIALGSVAGMFVNFMTSRVLLLKHR